MFCPKCGHEIQNDAAFCIRCGARIDLQLQQKNTWNQGQDGGHQTFSPSPEVTAAESKATASLVMGIISIVLSWLIVGIIFGPIAISLGKKARRVLNGSHHNFYIALAGVITGSIGLGLSIFFAIYWVVIIGIIGFSLWSGSGSGTWWSVSAAFLL